MTLSDYEITREDLGKFVKRTQWNQNISDYHRRAYDETGYDRYLDRADKISKCCKYAYCRCYRKQKVKVVDSIFTCRDRFCPQCQAGLAARRESKYKPVLDSFARDYDIYHMVITVPNPRRDELLGTVEKMFKKFKYLTRYFSGNKKASGVNFLQFRYAGLCRALEVTLKADGSFHPHFHCMVLLRKGLDLPQIHKNQYSFSENERGVRCFSDLEILIQKVWYLIFNDQKVTKESIENLKQGYSCTCEKVTDGNYHEVFKYVLKGLMKGDSFDLEYEDFFALEKAFYNRHIIQGYGKLHCIKEDVELEEKAESEFVAVEEDLKKVEQPVVVHLVGGVFDMLKDNRYIYISKSSIRRFIRDNAEKERKCERKEE